MTFYGTPKFEGAEAGDKVILVRGYAGQKRDLSNAYQWFVEIKKIWKNGVIVVTSPKGSDMKFEPSGHPYGNGNTAYLLRPVENGDSADAMAAVRERFDEEKRIAQHEADEKAAVRQSKMDAKKEQEDAAALKANHYNLETVSSLQTATGKLHILQMELADGRSRTVAFHTDQTEDWHLRPAGSLEPVMVLEAQLAYWQPERHRDDKTEVQSSRGIFKATTFPELVKNIVTDMYYDTW